MNGNVSHTKSRKEDTHKGKCMRQFFNGVYVDMGVPRESHHGKIWFLFQKDTEKVAQQSTEEPKGVTRKVGLPQGIYNLSIFHTSTRWWKDGQEVKKDWQF